MSGNWLVDELPCPLSPRDVGRYRVPLLVLNSTLTLGLLTYVLTSLFIDFLQKEEDLNRILELCM